MFLGDPKMMDNVNQNPTETTQKMDEVLGHPSQPVHLMNCEYGSCACGEKNNESTKKGNKKEKKMCTADHIKNLADIAQRRAFATPIPDNPTNTAFGVNVPQEGQQPKLKVIHNTKQMVKEFGVPEAKNPTLNNGYLGVVFLHTTYLDPLPKFFLNGLMVPRTEVALVSFFNIDAAFFNLREELAKANETVFRLIRNRHDGNKLPKVIFKTAAYDQDKKYLVSILTNMARFEISLKGCYNYYTDMTNEYKNLNDVNLVDFAEINDAVYEDMSRFSVEQFQNTIDVIQPPVRLKPNKIATVLDGNKNPMCVHKDGKEPMSASEMQQSILQLEKTMSKIENMLDALLQMQRLNNSK